MQADVDLLYAPLRSGDHHGQGKAIPGSRPEDLLGSTPSKYDLLPTLYEMRFNLTGRCGSVMYMVSLAGVELSRQGQIKQSFEICVFASVGSHPAGCM
jgi:hypothetical protein